MPERGRVSTRRPAGADARTGRPATTGRAGGTARGPNAERHARSRAALLDAALTVFARDGFAAARTADVVADTGLTRGALYYHFPDKLALFDAVVQRVAQGIAERIDAAARPAGDPVEGLRRGCAVWFDAMSEPRLRQVYLVDGPAALGLRRWREIDNEYGGGSLRVGVQAALDASPGNDLRVEPLTALLSGAVNEAALWLGEAPDPATAHRAVTDTLNVMLRRLFPPATSGS